MAKDSISTILGLEFVFIPLGDDDSYLEGNNDKAIVLVSWNDQDKHTWVPAVGNVAMSCLPRAIVACTVTCCNW